MFLTTTIGTTPAGAGVTNPPPPVAGATNIAVGASTADSSSGWGGGSYPWEMVDGLITYQQWYHGLAFTGGVHGYAGPCGDRQAVINFSEPKSFQAVRVWHHGDEHVPTAWQIQYWNGSQWVDVSSISHQVRWDMRAENYYTPDYYGAVPTEDVFAPVVASKVRLFFNNCTIEHGWIYEFEVFSAPLDTAPPMLILPPDMAVEATGPGGATVTFEATATDDVDGPRPVACTPSSGSTFALGSTTVTCSAGDLSGNTAADSFTVTVVDTTPPTLSVSANLTAEATGVITPLNFEATAADLVDGAVPVTCAPASGFGFPVGETTVTCTAQDGAGNTASGSFTVTVSDTTSPQLTLSADLIAEATSATGAPVGFETGATDLVDGMVPVTCAPASGSAFPLGVTVVNCTAIDAAGNSATGSFTITVVDTSAPTLADPPDLTVEATGPSGATVTYSITGTDTVDGTVAADCTPASGSLFALGAHEVHCTATDQAGNTSAGAAFAVSVVDTTPPTLGQLPQDIAAVATSAQGAIVSYTPPTASDLVDTSPDVVCFPEPGSMFPLGSTQVRCVAKDDAGNSSAEAAFQVSVEYGWSGVLQPINADGSSIFKAGSTIPVKFALSGASSGVSSATATLSYRKLTSQIEGEFVEAVTNVAATTGNVFRYDSTAGQYVFNWSTKGLTKGTYLIKIDLGDAGLRTVEISLK